MAQRAKACKADRHAQTVQNPCDTDFWPGIKALALGTVQHLRVKGRAVLLR